ncbi:MAG: hypothetical protein OXI55_09795 [Gammaproteobacteria bacterium]|nr:hypothetical protein [Gammaproteobacteria bacterium]
MTDDELKDLVAKIATAQDRADARQDRADARHAEADARHARIDAQLTKTVTELAKTDAKLDRLSAMYGGVSNNQGAVAEEFYYNSLKANPVLGDVRFDLIDKNSTRSRAGVEDEFDLLLVNGQVVYVVEVKYKAHESDLRRLLEVKAVNFPRLFPEYADHELRLALAAFHFHDGLKRAALKAGVTVLQRKGDVIESIAA